MKVSVMIPFVPARYQQVLTYAGLVKWTRAERLWQGQGLLTEGHQVFAAMAGAGFPIKTGIGVSLMPFRHPYLAAVESRSLAMTTGESFVAGIGPGAVALQKSIRGAAYASPLDATRDYCTIFGDLVRGRRVDHHGEYFQFSGALTPYPAPVVETGIGVLREKMATLAGEVADVAITWLTPARYLRDVIRPALEAGAASAERHPPRLVAMVPIATASRTRDPGTLASASNGPHLSLPHYRQMLRRSGIDLHDDAMDRDARALVDGDAFLYGDIDSLVGKLAEYSDAGVDEVVLNVAGVCATEGPAAAVDELKELLNVIEVLDK